MHDRMAIACPHLPWYRLQAGFSTWSFRRAGIGCYDVNGPDPSVVLDELVQVYVRWGPGSKLISRSIIAIRSVAS